MSYEQFFLRFLESTDCSFFLFVWGGGEGGRGKEGWEGGEDGGAGAGWDVRSWSI